MARVLLVGRGRPERGGIPAFLDLLRSSELAQVHDVELLNLADDGGRGGRWSSSNAVRSARDARRVWRAAKGADVVHVHSALAPASTMARAGLLAAMGRARRASVIVHAHGGRVQLFLTDDRRRRFARVVLAPASTIAAVSAGAEGALVAAVGSGRVVRIDNGVDVDRFRPVDRPDRTPTVLYAGVLTERKGVLDLVEASDRLAAEGVDHRLVLVGGDPPDGPGVADEIGGSEQVVKAGPRPPEAMPEAYADADVFCLPSWWEAMPLSVLEAMASGLPVVATAVGDVPRLVEDGVTGALVPARDPDALADALRRLLTDPDLRRAQGLAARAAAETRWNASKTIERIGELYDRSTHSRR